MKNIISIPTGYRCLAVDDSMARIDWFLRMVPNCQTATSPREAIKVLDKSGKFDVVFLDHDAVSIFTEPTDPDFLDKSFWRVAQYLHRTEYDGVVLIHSCNPIGAKRMAALLGVKCTVYVFPFGSFDVSIKY